MKGAPNETRTHSCRFARKPLSCAQTDELDLFFKYYLQTIHLKRKNETTD